MIKRLRPHLHIFSAIVIFGCVPVFLTSGLLQTILLGVQLLALVIQLAIVFTKE